MFNLKVKQHLYLVPADLFSQLSRLFFQNSSGTKKKHDEL